jgi:hypothetical protein
MNMPASVKVGPHVYSIVRKSSSVMKNNLGLCDVDSLQIWIKQKMRKSKCQEILLHELLHSTVHPTSNNGDTMDEEKFVTVSAPVLLGVLRDNPDLVEYLTK